MLQDDAEYQDALNVLSMSKDINISRPALPKSHLPTYSASAGTRTKFFYPPSYFCYEWKWQVRF